VSRAKAVILMVANEPEDVILMAALRRLRSSGQASRPEDLLHTAGVLSA